jgi:hypothetical protein
VNERIFINTVGSEVAAMAGLITIAGGLLGVMLLVGAVLYLTLGGIDFQWDDTTDQQKES